MIFINYHYDVDGTIRKYSLPVKLIAWYGVFALAFMLPYLFYQLLTKKNYSSAPTFLFLLLIAPAIFAVKISLDLPIFFTEDKPWNNYWQTVLYWPLLVIIIGTILYIIWNVFDKKKQPFYGIKTRGIDWRPYGLMLLIMLPLVAAASTQPDFQAMYPKLQSIEGNKLLFELSYGSDFITIELFFRGFLVLAFLKWAGKDAILPMACFYCTIHFGKPLGECISSYFGGMILGVIVYNTRSILGGLMVHLGIAWMMELAGYFVQLRIMLNIHFSIFNIQ